MELDDNGFLGEQVGDWSREFRKRYGSLLNRCKQLNWDAHSLLHSVEVHTKDGREIIVACLFMRAVEFYQAAILLLEQGMPTSAKGNVRSLLESVFILRAVAKCDKMLKAYIDNNEIQRLRTAKKMLNNPNPNEVCQKEDLRKIRDEIKQKGIRETKIKEFSEHADMYDYWYEDIYSLWLSPATHSSAHDLKRNLRSNDQQSISGLRYGPEDSKADQLLAHASYCLLLGFFAIANVFERNLKKPSDLRELWSKHEAFFKKVMDKLNAQVPLDRV